MQQHYSNVGTEEKRAAIARALRLLADTGAVQEVGVNSGVNRGGSEPNAGAAMAGQAVGVSSGVNRAGSEPNASAARAARTHLPGVNAPESVNFGVNRGGSEGVSVS
jgi:hypothetical protein